MIVRQGNRLIVSCPMTVDTVGDLLAEGANVWGAGDKRLEIDLAQVDNADSAGVSLMFEWLRQAQTGGVDVFFSNVPPALLSLAGLYGVLEIIPQTPHH